jgi:hypothetical protein
MTVFYYICVIDNYTFSTAGMNKLKKNATITFYTYNANVGIDKT